MNKNLLAGYVQEMMDDYERMGKGKPPLEWFRDAIKRHIHDITEEEARAVADKLIFGITAYKQEKARNKGGKAEMAEQQADVNEEDLKDVREDTKLMADAFIRDMEAAIKNKNLKE